MLNMPTAVEGDFTSLFIWTITMVLFMEAYFLDVDTADWMMI